MYKQMNENHDSSMAILRSKVGMLGLTIASIQGAIVKYEREKDRL